MNEQASTVRMQWLELKNRYPETILFFRLGDFYETFDDDAKLIAEALRITLTSKPIGKYLRVPLAGVPYHGIDAAVAKLVALGHRVGLCEPVAPERDTVRVISQPEAPQPPAAPASCCEHDDWLHTPKGCRGPVTKGRACPCQRHRRKAA